MVVNKEIEKKLNKLQSGTPLTYKEMCTALGEDVKTSNSKKAQIKKWSLMFKTEKIGNKYHILEVYTKHERTLQEHKSGNKYANQLCRVIIGLLADKQGKDLIISRGEIYEASQMVNVRYKNKDMTQFPQELLPYDNGQIKKDTFGVDTFFEIANQKMYDILQSSLKILERSELVECQDTFIVKYYNKIERVANDEERKKIKTISREILNDMGLQHIGQVYGHKPRNDYYTEFYDRLSKIKIEKCKRCCQITPVNIFTVYTEVEIEEAKHKLSDNVLESMPKKIRQSINYKNTKAREYYESQQIKGELAPKLSTINNNIGNFMQNLTQYFMNPNVDILQDSMKLLHEVSCDIDDLYGSDN